MKLKRDKMESLLANTLKLNVYYYITVHQDEVVLFNETEYYKTPFVSDAVLCPWKEIFLGVSGTTKVRVKSDIFGLDEEIVELCSMSEELPVTVFSRSITGSIHWFGEQSKTIGSSVMIHCDFDQGKNKITIMAGFENDVMVTLLQIEQIE